MLSLDRPAWSLLERRTSLLPSGRCRTRTSGPPNVKNNLHHVRDITPYFQSRLKKLGEKYECISDARGIGLLGCLEGYSNPLLDDKKRLEIDHQFGTMIDKAAEKRGLLVKVLLIKDLLIKGLLVEVLPIKGLLNQKHKNAVEHKYFLIFYYL